MLVKGARNFVTSTDLVGDLWYQTMVVMQLGWSESSLKQRCLHVNILSWRSSKVLNRLSEIIQA